MVNTALESTYVFKGSPLALITQGGKGIPSDIISRRMLVIEAGIPLPGVLINKTIQEIIIYQQKFAIFTLEALRKNKKNRPHCYQLTSD